MTDWERGYTNGYDAGFRAGTLNAGGWERAAFESPPSIPPPGEWGSALKPKRKRKLSDWQKYVKVNSKKPRFKYKSGSKKGRVNFKALGVASRKTPAGKKKRR